MDAARDVAAHPRTAPRSAFNFHPTVMQLQEAVDQRQAKPRTGPLAALAARRETLEHIGFHIRGQARAIVAHRDLDILADNAPGEHDLAAARREFESV